MLLAVKINENSEKKGNLIKRNATKDTIPMKLAYLPNLSATSRMGLIVKFKM